ncbi:helix-turn-helix domain-containing protein [Chryseobacterium oryctis]|uniref:Helix-turn-helix domain-containing protein n=1 Tax=Chryseobacterium oryctis TaxID=2952618 RepID=A0ABT3HRR2_9FLAO|nr:helix-turn-helix domain-containing protein [Chryseobacterium oryctis]MCW3162434.1 helix-turn-helix domain-containing protein [Chryseobacterium oryctis]
MNCPQNSPDYNKIYSDIIAKKFPHKWQSCKSILEKETLTSVDIIKINEKIFDGIQTNSVDNQRLRAYSKEDILKILEYQTKNRLNKSQLAAHFRLSRNTITKWRRLYLVDEL